MSHKPLVSSAPAHSILNAGFRYTNSTATDVRKTFARIRREQASAAARASTSSNVRAITRKSEEVSSSSWANCK